MSSDVSLAIVVDVVDVLVDVDVVDEVDEVEEVVDDSAVSSAGLQAARRRVSVTNPAIAVRIQVSLRRGPRLTGIDGVGSTRGQVRRTRRARHR